MGRDRTSQMTGKPTKPDVDRYDDSPASSGERKIVCTMMNETYGFGNF